MADVSRSAIAVCGLVLFCSGMVSGKRRRQILERDGYTCEECGVVGYPGAPWLEIDHRVPIAYGGSDDESNLRVLCRPCNAAKSDNPDIGEQRRAEIELAYCPPPPPLFAVIDIELNDQKDA